MDSQLLLNLMESRTLAHFDRNTSTTWPTSAFTDHSTDSEDVWLEIMHGDDPHDLDATATGIAPDGYERRMALRAEQQTYVKMYFERLWELISNLANGWLVGASGADWIDKLAAKDARRLSTQAGREGKSASRQRYNAFEPGCSLRALNDSSMFPAARSPARESYVRELVEWRNRWAHREPLSWRDINRAVDTARFLVNEVGQRDIRVNEY